MCDFFFFKQKPAYEMRISDWSSDVCSSDLLPHVISQARDGLLVESERIGADPGDVQCHGMIAIAGQHLVCRALGSAVVAGGQLDVTVLKKHQAAVRLRFPKFRDLRLGALDVARGQR